MWPDDDEAEEEELVDELESILDDDTVTYIDHDGQKKSVSPYSWGENGC